MKRLLLEIVNCHAISLSLIYQAIQMLSNVPFIFCSSGREPSGMLVSKWRVRRGIPLYWADCINIYRYISSLSCCSSRKYIRERSCYIVCIQKRPLLMCAISTPTYINKYDGETTELITSLPKHSPYLMSFPHLCSFLKETVRNNLPIYKL